MFLIVDEIDFDPALVLKRVFKRRQRPITEPRDLDLGIVQTHAGRDFAVRRTRRIKIATMSQVGQGTFRVQIGLVKRGLDHFRQNLAACIGDRLNDTAEFHLQSPRQIEAITILEHIGHAAFAGLAIDPNHVLISAPHVGGINRQIGDLPQFVVVFESLKALFNRVLVTA